MDIYEKLNSGYYKNKMRFPTKPLKPLVSKKCTSEELFQKAQEMKAYEEEKKFYESEWLEYRKETGRLEDEFKKDVLEYFGITNHPKADKIYSYAYMKGHSAGFGEVLNKITELMDYGLI